MTRRRRRDAFAEREPARVIRLIFKPVKWALSCTKSVRERSSQTLWIHPSFASHSPDVVHLPQHRERGIGEWVHVRVATGRPGRKRRSQRNPPCWVTTCTICRVSYCRPGTSGREGTDHHVVAIWIPKGELHRCCVGIQVRLLLEPGYQRALGNASSKSSTRKNSSRP